MRPLLIYSTYVLSIVYLSVFQHPLYTLLSIPIVVLIVIDIFNFYESYDFGTVGFFIIQLFRFNTLKRVKTDFGRFYLKIKYNNNYADEVILYKDKFFYLSEISRRYYDGNIDDVKKWVKEEYDSIYNDFLKKKEKFNTLKSWNGYIDLQSERDEKLKKLVK